MDAQERIVYLENLLARKTRKLELIQAIDHIRDTTPEPQTMLTSIIQTLGDMVEADLCLLALLNRETAVAELKTIHKRTPSASQLQELMKRDLFEHIMTHRTVIEMDAQKWMTDGSHVYLAAVPIILGDDQLLGSLLLARYDTPFTEAEHLLLEVAEGHIDSAVMQSYAYQDLQLRLKELQTIYRIDHIRDRALPFDEMLNAILQELGQIIDAEMGFVMLYDHSGERLELRAVTNRDLFEMTNHYEEIHQLANQSLQDGRIVWQNGELNGLGSIICIPLILKRQRIGVLGVANRPGGVQFTMEDRQLMNAIGSQIDTAIFESMEKRHLRDVLGRSVDPRIMERLLANRSDEFLLGERIVVTVLYADMRGSTALAEQTQPELLVDFINRYLGAMTEVILKFEGTLDKFVGDQVMALFGAPFPMKDQALRAVQVGLAMQEAHQNLLAEWVAEGGMNAPIGIGIATGELIVGEMGSSQRTDYTVIGKAANLGARICGAAQAGQVLIDPDTYEQVKDRVQAIPITGQRFKGVRGELTVYDIQRILP